MTHITARSISRSIRELLRQTPFVAHVLAVFDHACDLATPDGDVITLVTRHIGDGPLNIVVDAEAGVFAALKPGLPATLHHASLQVGEMQVELNGARVWEPCPDWGVLRNHQNIVASRLLLLRTVALHYAPTECLLNIAATKGSAGHFLCVAIQRATQALKAGWDGDQVRWQAGATQLAGLGSGLTPAGDDFLVGVMLWAWLAHPTPRNFCCVIVETAAPRTTTLSAAFLRSAAKGECNAAWHRLLASLASDAEDQLYAATRQVLSHGATSGADTLAGFLALDQTFEVSGQPKVGTTSKV
jgi:hypothetical protein